MKLTDIKTPADLKGLDIPTLKDLAQQMRDGILQRTSDIGGHVSPNLGSAESILALHYVFDAPVDKLVFDVSHQAFPHKMVTGRADGYFDPEMYDKVGEYTDPTESPVFDLFYAGHTSPSISLCVGLAKARDLRGEHHNVVAYIGDGALSGGQAFEGMDAAGALGSNFIIVLNDNQMAIAENHGGMYAKLAELRETSGTADDNLFRAFGLDYIYVPDGNDLEQLIDAYRRVKDIDHPVVVHVATRKGDGYVPAERDREAFHYRSPFKLATGERQHTSNKTNYLTLTRDWVLEKARANKAFFAISSATPDSFGLTPDVRRQLGHQYIDVAIAEQTGVAVASGAAKGGARPVYLVVATFLQRAYDQLIEDLAMNSQPAVLAVFGGGAAFINDTTHLGFWDIPMLSNIANLVYLAPTNADEYLAMMEWAVTQTQHSVAVRVPSRGCIPAEGPVDSDYSDLNKFKIVKRGRDVAIIGVGDMLPTAMDAAKLLEGDGIEATVINPRFISGLDTAMLDSLLANHRVVVTVEDGALDGGFGQKVASYYGPTPMRVRNYGLKKEFLDHFDLEQLYHDCRMTPQQIADDVKEMLK